MRGRDAGPLADVLRELRDETGGIRRLDAIAGERRVGIASEESPQAALSAVRVLATPIVSLTGVGTTDIVATGEGDRSGM